MKVKGFAVRFETPFPDHLYLIRFDYNGDRSVPLGGGIDDATRFSLRSASRIARMMCYHGYPARVVCV